MNLASPSTTARGGWSYTDEELKKIAEHLSGGDSHLQRLPNEIKWRVRELRGKFLLDEEAPFGLTFAKSDGERRWAIPNSTSGDDFVIETVEEYFDTSSDRELRQWGERIETKKSRKALQCFIQKRLRMNYTASFSRCKPQIAELAKKLLENRQGEGGKAASLVQDQTNQFC